MGHSEGIVRMLMLALGPTLPVGVPALIALGLVLLPAQVQSQELMHWVTATGLDTATLLFGLAAVLLIAAALGVVFATRAQRRRERQSEKDRASPASLDELAIGHWVEEGQRFLSLWQERIERLDELQGRLAAMALEIDQLRAHVIYLTQEGEALLLERDYLRSILARIGELIQRVSEVRPEARGGAAPEVGP